MMLNTFKSKVLLIGLLLIMLVLIFAFMWLDNQSPEQVFAKKYDGNWQNAIEVLGGSEAHQLFKQINNKLDVNTQHDMAHDFGRALFEVEGIAGTATCDADYGFGCYHEFFLSAVANEGLDVIYDLDQACIDKNGFGGQGCQHGIGHGLLQYFGHSRINEALNTCAQLQWQEPLFGCQSGVFMEYNFPTPIEGVTEQDAGNKFSEDDPYHPCDSVPVRFKFSCLYTLPTWWTMSVDLDVDKMGELCEAVPGQRYSDICYKGLARALVQLTSFDMDQSLEYCGQMPEGRGQVICKAGLAWSFWDSEFSDNFKKPCQTLEGDEYVLCANEADPLGTMNLLEQDAPND